MLIGHFYTKDFFNQLYQNIYIIFFFKLSSNIFIPYLVLELDGLRVTATFLSNKAKIDSCIYSSDLTLWPPIVISWAPPPENLI